MSARQRNDDPLGELDPKTAASLLAVAGDIALIIDERGIIRDVERSDVELPIEGSDAWIGQKFVDTVTLDSRGKAESLWTEVAKAGLSRRRQLNYPSQTGPDVPVVFRGIRIGRDRQVVAVGRDVRNLSLLQQRLVEAQQAMERDYWRLRHVETRYRLLFQAASEAILVVNANTLKVVDANAAAGTLFADTADRLVGRTFPFGFSADVLPRIQDMVNAARAGGRGTEQLVTVSGPGMQSRNVAASATTFRQDTTTLLLVRLASVPTTGSEPAATGRTTVMELLAHAPDGFAVTDLEGQIRFANRAFLDIAELATEEQARGASIGNWIGRPGADLSVFQAMLKKYGVVRLMNTSSHGAHGASTEVEVSAVWVPEGEDPSIGFLIRDVGRRLATSPQGARDLTRAVEQLTGLVGKVALRELLRDTSDLVERHFIEAALELTEDNRTSAAEILGISRQSLYVKLRHHRLQAENAERDKQIGS